MSAHPKSLEFSQEALDAAVLDRSMFEALDGLFSALDALISPMDDEAIAQLSDTPAGPKAWPWVSFLRGVEENFRKCGLSDEETTKIIDSLRELTRRHVGCRSFLLTVKLMLRVFQAGLIPLVSADGIKFHVRQAAIANKPRTKNGMTPDERKERNEKIRKAFAASRLTKNAFIKRHAERKTYPKGNGQFLSASAIRDALKQS